MYTTLALLKDVKACVPGYTRMISFFSTKAEMKDVKIPLFMVSMVAGREDAEWAIHNGAVIDEQQFNAVYERNLWRVLRCLFWQDIDSGDYQGTQQVHALTEEACAEIDNMNSHEQALAFIAKYRMRSFSAALTRVLTNSALFSPVAFIRFLSDKFTTEYTYEHKRYRSHSAKDAPAVKSAATLRSRISRARDDDEDEDEDDEPRPVTRGIGSRQKDYYFEYTDSSSSNYSFARVLAGSKDPFFEATKFLVEHNLMSKTNLKGLMISQVHYKEPPGFHLSLNVSDPETIFKVVHMLTSKAFDINEVFGVNRVGDVLEKQISALSDIKDDDASSLDLIQVREGMVSVRCAPEPATADVGPSEADGDDEDELA